MKNIVKILCSVMLLFVAFVTVEPKYAEASFGCEDTQYSLSDTGKKGTITLDPREGGCTDPPGTGGDVDPGTGEDPDPGTGEDPGTPVEEEIFLGEFVEYTNELGVTVTEPYSPELITELEAKSESNQKGDQLDCIACVGDFTYYSYKVYNQGITKSWSYLSNPYFIISIARGATYKSSIQKSTTISASYSGTIPSKSAVNQTFGLSASGTKTITFEVSLSGPSGKYNSRDFYYKKGRHTYKVKTVKSKKNKSGKVLSSSTYYGYVGKPAVKHYSVDTY
ncbi:hypothetical protein [Bacillus sp. P14.5]|uniref:hypothetical protein n=1 Tax=Bacillus sp. P14.5 TaxID=1983400 RepID=UPI000DEACB95|nr:hypothetical protein [Bacillus sp. P14.5]